MKKMQPSELQALLQQQSARIAQLEQAQIKQAQIEAALERVRAAGMAMQSTNEFQQVIDLVYRQLSQLGIGFASAILGVLEDAGDDLSYWVSTGDPEKGYTRKVRMPFIDNPIHTDHLRALERGLEVFEVEYPEEVTRAYFQKVVELSRNVPPERSTLLLAASKYIQSTVFCKNTYMAMLRLEGRKFTPSDIGILKRFSQVFEQTYIRFLDIQKAENQAREAQIEAALERVRAASMAMQKTNDLGSVTSEIFNQLKELGLNFFNSWLSIFDLEKEVSNNWFSPLAGVIEEPFYAEISMVDFPLVRGIVEQWQSSQTFTYHSYTGEEVKGFVDFVSASTGLPYIQEFYASNRFKQIHVTDANHRFGNLGIGTIDLPGKADQEILRRFAMVFEQTYTRFLDIQKAEEQARQLEIVFRENQRLLHSILPESIAEQIRTGSKTVVQRFDSVSILFADIVGFTVLSERITPQEVVDILNGLFSRFDDLTDQYQLEKIKTIGDAYMVAAGVPEKKNNHAQLIFSFAREMLQTLQDFNLSSGLDLKIRIGISSGPVVAGVIGKKKFAYDLWGDTVNTAARMEAYGRQDCIQVSPATYQILKQDFDFEKIPDVAIKGKGKMDVYMWSWNGSSPA